MNASATLKASMDRRGDGGMPPRGGGQRQDYPGDAAGIALWVFIGVATSLFTLFIWAYVMRMDGTDWSPIAMPWQLWLSTGLLLAGSITLQGAAAAAGGNGTADRARVLLLAGGGFALAFLGIQLWGWQSLLAGRVTLTGNPAASFFYLLTALHGFHVIGGLVGWAMTARHLRHGDMGRIASGIGLCARYWHFLLAVWLVLFATLGWLTPEVVRFICGTN